MKVYILLSVIAILLAAIGVWHYAWALGAAVVLVAVAVIVRPN
jgi:hypothetical protein